MLISNGSTCHRHAAFHVDPPRLRPLTAKFCDVAVGGVNAFLCCKFSRFRLKNNQINCQINLANDYMDGSRGTLSKWHGLHTCHILSWCHSFLGTSKRRQHRNSLLVGSLLNIMGKGSQVLSFGPDMARFLQFSIRCTSKNPGLERKTFAKRSDFSNCMLRTFYNIGLWTPTAKSHRHTLETRCYCL